MKYILREEEENANSFTSFCFLLSYMQLTLMASHITPLCRADPSCPMCSSEKELCRHWMTATGKCLFLPHFACGVPAHSVESLHNPLFWFLAQHVPFMFSTWYLIVCFVSISVSVGANRGGTRRAVCLVTLEIAGGSQNYDSLHLSSSGEVTLLCFMVKWTQKPTFWWNYEK